MVEILHVSKEDMDQVEAIISEVTNEWGKGWRELISRMFQNEHHSPFSVERYAAKLGSKVVGLLAVKKEICASVIYFLAVEKNYRRRKIGKKLLEHAQKIAKNSKCSFLRVDVYDFYEENKEFYKKNGFILSGTVANYYEIGDRQAFFFKKI